MIKNKLIHLVWPPLLIYLVYLIPKLVWFDSLSTLANDSVHYLVMARHYSPWLAESPAIASAWPLQDFPPFFPWVLALTGAAHSLLYAHLLVAVVGLASLYLYYLLACRWLTDRALAILPLLLYSLSPGFILGLQGILSETLYLFLVLSFLLLYTSKRRNTRAQITLLILLLTAILLTRTTGITLALAIVTQAIFSGNSLKKFLLKPVLIAATSVFLYFLLMALWGPVKQSHYLGLLFQFVSGVGLYEAGSNTAVQFSLMTQLKYQLDAWQAFWLLFWDRDVYSVSFFVILALSFVSLSGLFLRLAKNKLDAWYVLFFILILLLWPHPGQLFRLVSPIMPLLLIYAGYGIKILLDLKKENKIKTPFLVIFYLAILVATLPAHAFIRDRLNLAASKNLAPIYETFRHADNNVAMNDLILQNQIMKDFAHIKDSVSINDIILYFVPSYLAILSDRPGITAPSPIDADNYRELAVNSNARYIFLTRLHPRNSRPGYNGFRGATKLDDWTTLVWCSQFSDGGFASCLVRITD